MRQVEKFIVVCKWIESYDNPITLKKNEKVIIDLAIKDSDPEWCNWCWCTTNENVSGWVPIQILELHEPLSNNRQVAIATETYSANELSVNQHDVVISSKRLNGWVWCQKENSFNAGWVPLKCLRPIEIL